MPPPKPLNATNTPANNPTMGWTIFCVIESVFGIELCLFGIWAGLFGFPKTILTKLSKIIPKKIDRNWVLLYQVPSWISRVVAQDARAPGIPI